MNWYTNLSTNQLRQTHVHVRYRNGVIIDGRLDNYGTIETPSLILDAEILKKSEDNTSWEIADEEIESVDFVWNEHDMEPIDIEEVEKGDYIVLHDGHCERISSCGKHYIITDSGYSVHKKGIAIALRKKLPLPTELGAYVSDKGDLVIHSNDSWWTVYEPGYKHRKEYISMELPTKYRNLTPVEFEKKD